MNSTVHMVCVKCGRDKQGNEVSTASSTPPLLEKKETSVSTVNDIAAQIKEFKKLLDEGLITEEEFAAKKKQILGI